MQKLGLNEDSEDTEFQWEERFWKRQVQQRATASQKRFDWFFGVLLPVICFTFDPIVFTSETALGKYKAFAYTLSFVSVMAMAAWLIWGAKLKWLNAFLAGLFVVGGFISLGIGIIIFPISLIGLFFYFIGALGFTPLFTAVVFLRNSIRSYQSAKPFLEKRVLVYSFLLSAIFSAVVPSVINVEINKLAHKRMNENNSNLTRTLTN